ncbi:MAG: MFS transporter [Candidatus Poseidoniaceae archaeon]|jgi:UMF1 family MFS transporter|nr:MFS transporter [Candidatus Poseidoniaceae archaeon]
MGETISRSRAEKKASRSEEKRKAIFGYGMFDWAKSAFETSVVSAILPAWFTYLFLEANGVSVNFTDSFSLTADTAWAFATMASALLVAAISPALGIIADRKTIKMLALKCFSWLGAGATILLAIGAYLPIDIAWIFILITYFFANVGLNASSVFYNAVLPFMGENDELDEISNLAFAYGYLGGGILLLIHLVMVMTLEGSWVIPFTLASSGLWWFGFAWYTFAYIPEPEIENEMEWNGFFNATKMAISELYLTSKEIKKFKVLFLYMLSYFLFIDGINSVTALAGSFGSAVLGIPIATLMIVILLVQFVGAPAAIGFTRLAEKTSAKTALTIACIGWCVVIILGVGFAPLMPVDVNEYDAVITSDDGVNYQMENKEDNIDDLFVEGNFSSEEITGILSTFEDSRFSVIVVDPDGSNDGLSAIGIDNPASIGDEKGDGWAVLLRDNVWQPLGLGVNVQFLILGLLSGLLLGGSQGLARSLFSKIIPETRSTEFFGFFGFFGKVAAFIGPFLYAVVGGYYGSRAGLVAIAMLIVAGTIILRWVDFEEGVRVAKEEDIRNRNS